MDPLLGCAVLELFALSVKADVEAGLQAYKKGDYSTALKELRPLAEHGDAQAQGVLGRMYDFGHGVPQDYKEAVKWYRLAADQGTCNSPKSPWSAGNESKRNAC